MPQTDRVINKKTKKINPVNINMVELDKRSLKGFDDSKYNEEMFSEIDQRSQDFTFQDNGLINIPVKLQMTDINNATKKWKTRATYIPSLLWKLVGFFNDFK